MWEGARQPVADNYERRFRLDQLSTRKGGPVVDGDSAWVEIDLGWGVSWHHELRLAHLNAAESHKPLGPELTAFHRDWYALHAAHLGGEANETWPFLLRGQKTEKYGRVLEEVYCGQGHYLNAELLKQPGVVPMEG